MTDVAGSFAPVSFAGIPGVSAGGSSNVRSFRWVPTLPWNRDHYLQALAFAGGGPDTGGNLSDGRTLGVLEVEFLNGGQYQYSPARYELFTAMLSADSRGGFVAKRLRGGGVPYVKVG